MPNTSFDLRNDTTIFVAISIAKNIEFDLLTPFFHLDTLPHYIHTKVFEQDALNGRPR